MQKGRQPIVKFDKAYCEQLESFITPYLARELYFDESSGYYQKELHFMCPDISCRVDLVGVNIYNKKRNKKALHFRTKPKTEHKCAKYHDRGSQKPSDSKTGDEEGFKVTKYPSEFLLERPQSGKGTVIIEIEEFESSGVNSSEYSQNPTPNDKKSILKTSCLDHLVDCYINGSQDEIKKQTLTIDSKTKTFFNFFKIIKYYQDEEGLIYWGEINHIKKYGQNYRIIFKDRPSVNGKNLPASIYIKNELIERYRKNKMFRVQIEELIKAKKPVLCFFVGVYPKPVEVEWKTKFEVLEVDITNLDHISFAFSE